MQVGMNEIMQKYHLHHRLQTDHGELLPVLLRMVLILPLHVVQHGLSLHEPFHQDLPARQAHQRLGERDPRLALEVPAKPLQIVRLHPEVELREHNIPKLIDAVLHAEVIQIQVGNALEKGGHFVHDVKVQADLFEYAGVLDLDGDGGPGGMKTVGGTEAGLIHLRDASGSDGYGRHARTVVPIIAIAVIAIRLAARQQPLLPLPIPHPSLPLQPPPLLPVAVVVPVVDHGVEAEQRPPVLPVRARERRLRLVPRVPSRLVLQFREATDELGGEEVVARGRPLDEFDVGGSRRLDGPEGVVPGSFGEGAVISLQGGRFVGRIALPLLPPRRFGTAGESSQEDVGGNHRCQGRRERGQRGHALARQSPPLQSRRVGEGRDPPAEFFATSDQVDVVGPLGRFVPLVVFGSGCGGADEGVVFVEGALFRRDGFAHGDAAGIWEYA
mmetsp:Transcript_23425/g.44464  ORF Transcript_23425/g.44464 Transcript_23425/m.44464 type:complete len:442 (+) Transcript_23425:545-1870(+)